MDSQGHFRRFNQERERERERVKEMSSSQDFFSYNPDNHEEYENLVENFDRRYLNLSNLKKVENVKRILDSDFW